MAETGLGAELARMRYGADLGDVLNKIGGQIRESRLSDQAQQTLAQLSGVDISTPEGLETLRKSVFSLSQMEQPGQTALGAINEGIYKPLQVQSVLEDQKVQRLKGLIGTYDKDLADYHADLRNKNVSQDTLDARYQELQNRYNQYLQMPAFKGHEYLLGKPEASDTVKIAGRGVGTNLQEKGVTEKGSLTVSYDPSTGRLMVANKDGSVVPYDAKTHGKVIQTALPQVEFALEQELANRPDSVEAAANMYSVGQPLPFGFTGGLSRLRALDRSAAQYREHNLLPEDRPLVKAQYDANARALTTLSVQSQSVLAFEKTAEANLKVALDQSKRTGRAESPALNTLILAWKRYIQGKADVAELNAAARDATNEVARVVTSTTGSQVPETEREAYAGLLGSALNEKTFEGVINIFIKNMKNRKKGYEDQLNEVRDKLRNWWDIGQNQNEFDKYKVKE